MTLVEVVSFGDSLWVNLSRFCVGLCVFVLLGRSSSSMTNNDIGNQ